MNPHNVVMTEAPSQRILENLSTAVVVVDGGLRLRSINPAGELLFQLSARQILGQSLAELLTDNAELIQALRQAHTSQHPFTEHGLRLMLSGARELTVDCSVTPLSHGSQADELLIEFTRIDKLLRLAREESMQDQQDTSRAVIRGLAHEIKNPLGGLRGAAQLLERELPSKSLQEYTRIIIREADRLRNLVDRMVGPNTPLNKQPTNIHQIFEHVRSLILAEIPAGIEIERDYDPSLPEFPGDAEQLLQAILNIARNAVQAIDHSGVIRFRSRIERQMTVGQKRRRLVLRAEIEDNGPGIPADLRERIFFPMVTGRADGTGLGLSIAQTIVHQHGGAIECDSRPGRTIFRIYFPLENGHD